MTHMAFARYVAVFAISTLTLGLAQATDDTGYWLDSAGAPIKSGAGSCVRSSNWSAERTHFSCDPLAPDRIVLLPGPDGAVGAVVIQSRMGAQRLDASYAGMAVAKDGALTSSQETPASVTQRFGAALQAMPMRPVSFIVSFASGSLKELTPEATVVFEQVKAELAMRPAPEITVIGHTDLVGNADANDKLSGIRAEVVKHLLVAAGLKADRIEAAGRGEREPLVPTAHGVAEARNRRVEINIR